MVELKQWTILIALFSYYVPPSCVCYCRAVGYVEVGAKAEAAEYEHSISNNSKFCVVILGLFLKRLAGKGTLGLWPEGIKCKITRYAKGSLKSGQCFCSAVLLFHQLLCGPVCTCEAAMPAIQTDMCIQRQQLTKDTAVKQHPSN